MRSEVLKRGARADTANAGQGIGLAMVVELAASYGGRLEVGASNLGGAMVTLELPV
jgi:two-component system sensor histidine kinase PhoQ